MSDADDLRRLGAGHVFEVPEDEDLADFVLGKFAPEEDEGVEEMLDRAADAATAWLLEGTEPAMSRFNGPAH